MNREGISLADGYRDTLHISNKGDSIIVSVFFVELVDTLCIIDFPSV